MEHGHITRRDFINGMLVSLGSTMIPPLALFKDPKLLFEDDVNPPRITGLRGNHPGSFEVAHALACEGKTDWGAVQEDDDPSYDLVVVGAGISGLAAARFFQQHHGTGKRILVLDNHANFGGIAQRNEFVLNGTLHINYGGSQSMEPDGFSRKTRALLKDLGVNLDRFQQAYDFDFFKRHRLRPVTFFHHARYGRDHLANNAIYDLSGLMPGLKTGAIFSKDDITGMPLTDAAKKQLLAVMQHSGDALKKIPASERRRYIRKTPYFAFLKEHLSVDDPQVLHLLRYIPVDDWGMGSDVQTVLEAIESGAPGYDAMGWSDEGDETPYIHHFPDGNASIARLLVRKLVPTVAPGSDMEDIVLAPFDYGCLDKPESHVRIRLNSTVVQVRHDGPFKEAKEVLVTYVNRGQARRVRAKNVILACQGRIIPDVMSELPSGQKAALKKLLRMPLVYSTILLDNWHALATRGIGAAMCPGNLHHIVLPDYPVALGGYPKQRTPDQPMALTMVYVPLSDRYGTAPLMQFRVGRYTLLNKSFDDFEQEIKQHLGAMLGPAGFDPDKNIKAITVNRWPHGYSYEGCALHDPAIDAHVAGRKPFGRIAIAGADAESRSYIDAAIDQAWRAVRELA